MVKPYAALIFVALLAIVGCSEQEQKAEDVSSASSKESKSPSTATPAVLENEVKTDSLYLRYNVGSNFRYRVKQSMTSTEDSATANQTSSYVYTKKVLSGSPDKGFQVEMTLKEISSQASIKNNKSGKVMLEETYRSKNKADRNDLKNAQFNYALDVPVKLSFSKSASLTNVEGIKPIAAKLVEKMPNVEQATPQQKNAVMMQLEQQIAGQLYSSVSLQEFVPYPDNLVLNGLTWTNTRTAPIAEMFNLTTETEYTIVKVEEQNGVRLATIKATLTGTVVPNPKLEASGIKVKIATAMMSGTSTSTVDLNTGVTHSKKNRISSSFIADVERVQTGEKRRVTQKQESSYELTLLD